MTFKILNACKSSHCSIRLSRTAEDFAKTVCLGSQHAKASHLIAVYTGMNSSSISGFLQRSKWAGEIITLFSDQEFWEWRYKLNGEENDRVGNADLIELVNDDASPILASLIFRQFGDTDIIVGTPQWFERRIETLSQNESHAFAFFIEIMNSVNKLLRNGLRFMLEKITFINSTDVNRPITLTPQLHRDGSYGLFESSVVSFFSPDSPVNQSTIFFPDFDYKSTKDLRPVTAQKLSKHFPTSTGYSLPTGYLSCFSGKLDEKNARSDERGALHISPEGFMRTKRAVFLFRVRVEC